MKRLFIFTIIITLALLCTVSCDDNSNNDVNPNEKPNTEQPSEKPNDEIEAENNKIYYTTSNGKKIFPTDSMFTVFGANLISNTYENGQGVLTFDDTITSIGWAAFSYCGELLTSISIPDSVTSIGGSAFSYCTSLTSITIPDRVTEIGECAFYQ